MARPGGQTALAPFDHLSASFDCHSAPFDHEGSPFHHLRGLFDHLGAPFDNLSKPFVHLGAALDHLACIVTASIRIQLYVLASEARLTDFEVRGSRISEM